jgi:hypothetical protein
MAALQPGEIGHTCTDTERTLKEAQKQWRFNHQVRRTACGRGPSKKTSEELTGVTLRHPTMQRCAGAEGHLDVIQKLLVVPKEPNESLVLFAITQRGAGTRSRRRTFGALQNHSGKHQYREKTLRGGNVEPRQFPGLRDKA